MNDKRSNYLFTTIFIISIIYTTLRLFSLQDDLILSSQVLDSSQIASLSPVLLQLYIAVGITILTGVIILAMNFNAGATIGQMANLSSDNTTAEDENLKSSDGSANKKIKADVKFIDDALKNVKDKNEKYSTVLNSICKKLELGQGAIYTPTESNGTKYVEFYSGYAFNVSKNDPIKFEFGEGLVGQAAKEKEILVIDEIPDNYISIISGLGHASPKHLIVLPLLNAGKLEAIAELASFTQFSEENIILIRESFNLLNNPVSTSKKIEEKEKEAPKVKPEKKSPPLSREKKEKKDE